MILAQSRILESEQETYSVAAYHVALHVETDQITDSHHGEVDSQWVDPEAIAELGIADANVSSDPFSVAFATKDAKCAGKMLERPVALRSVRFEPWETFHGDTSMPHCSKR